MVLQLDLPTLHFDPRELLGNAGKEFRADHADLGLRRADDHGAGIGLRSHFHIEQARDEFQVLSAAGAVCRRYLQPRRGVQLQSRAIGIPQRGETPFVARLDLLAAN